MNKKHDNPKFSWANFSAYLKQGKVHFPSSNLADLYPDTHPFLKPIMDGCKELQDAKKKVSTDSLVLANEIMLHRITQTARLRRSQVPPDHGDTIRKFMRAFRVSVERSEEP